MECVNSCSFPFMTEKTLFRKGEKTIKIVNSEIGMESARSYSEIRKDAYSGSTWSLCGKRSDMSFSEMALSMSEYENASGESFGTTKKTESGEDPGAAIRKKYEDMKLSARSRFEDEQTIYLEMQAACIDYLLMLFLGIDISKWRHVRDGSGRSPVSMLSGLQSAGLTQGQPVGGSYAEYHYHEESETATFSTQGTAVCADGRRLTFDLDLTMSREFMEESSMEMNYGASVAVDPLVIQLSGSPATVSDQTFMFDIDSDGVEDRIASLVEGTGFLALDKNEDGSINDGSELFGTKTGNGFEELAEYDQDGNGWIDENDEIYSRLKIWTKDSQGREKLMTLKESDVGAIYLDSRRTDFTVRDLAGEKAKVRRTGIFLRESTGMAGTVQQFDMVKQAYA